MLSWVIQEELKLRQREASLSAERQVLVEHQAANSARDAELEMMHLKYHLAAMQINK
jgi:hypothetical protein